MSFWEREEGGNSVAKDCIGWFVLLSKNNTLKLILIVYFLSTDSTVISVGVVTKIDSNLIKL
jgi:hypothetical protein